jgi:hypothetical protein
MANFSSIIPSHEKLEHDELRKLMADYKSFITPSSANNSFVAHFYDKFNSQLPIE